MKQKTHPRLVEQFERDELEYLGIERDHVAGVERRRQRAARDYQPLQQIAQRARDHWMAGTVVRRHEAGVADFFGAQALGVKRHQWHDQRGGGVAAEKAVPLRQDDIGAGFCRAERRSQSGRAAADDQHVRFRRETRATRRQRQRLNFTRAG